MSEEEQKYPVHVIYIPESGVFLKDWVVAVLDVSEDDSTADGVIKHFEKYGLSAEKSNDKKQIVFTTTLNVSEFFPNFDPTQAYPVEYYRSILNSERLKYISDRDDKVFKEILSNYVIECELDKLFGNVPG